jgi:hypothetical protein
VLLCADAASADLASGALACPSCGAGRLRPWGHGRERVIRLRGGARARLSPRRGRCGACQVTHILLPSWMASRRADAVGVIAAAAVASALHGTGQIGADLGVPAGTVRGWLRRLRVSAGAMRQDAMVTFGRITAGHDAPYPQPSGSALGDALSAVAACAHAAITFCGRTAADWEPLLGLFGLAASSPRHPAADPARPPGLPHARRQAATLTMSTRRHPRRASPSP